jgi:hypothetical protein
MKSTRRRRSKPKTNLTNIAVSALVANSITQGAFGVDLKTFIMGSKIANATNNTGAPLITASELFSGLTGGSAGTSGGMMMGGKYLSYGDTLANTIKSNVQDNWVSMVAGVVLIPVVAKSVTKLIRKPVILPANRMLKSTGLDVKL